MYSTQNETMQDAKHSVLTGELGCETLYSCERCIRRETTVQSVSWIVDARSGGAIAVKEPAHFEVRKSSSQVTRMHFFPQKSWRPFFSCRPQNVQAANAVSPSE